MSSDEASVEIIARLTPAILRALHALEFTSRHISPANLRELIAAVGKRDDDLDRQAAQPVKPKKSQEKIAASHQAKPATSPDFFYARATARPLD